MKTAPQNRVTIFCGAVFCGNKVTKKIYKYGVPGISG